jgi:phage replication-related protein YjqB (UPF0714/DUF867 family)
MVDRYKNFQDLASAERLDIDYQIRLCKRASPVAIIAPHGGMIESGTSVITVGIAGGIHSFYCFEGIKTRSNKDLHLTSTRFDEPSCVGLVAACDYVIAVHGCKGSDRKVYLGGLDQRLEDAIRDKLESSGFEAGKHDDSDLQGRDPLNICNRGRRGRGVQLEISKGLRRVLQQAASSGHDDAFSDFIKAVQRAIKQITG